MCFVYLALVSFILDFMRRKMHKNKMKYLHSLNISVSCYQKVREDENMKLEFDHAEKRCLWMPSDEKQRS